MTDIFTITNSLQILLREVENKSMNTEIYRYIITKYIVYLSFKYINLINNSKFNETFFDKLKDLYINENISVMKQLYESNRLTKIINQPNRKKAYEYNNIIIYPDDIIDWSCDNIYPKTENYLCETAKIFESFFWYKANIFEKSSDLLTINNVYKTEICGICLDLLDKNDKILKCGHILHNDCYREWKKYKNKCPYCNKIL